MTDTTLYRKVSELNQVTGINPALDQLYLVQGGTASKKVIAQALVDLIPPGPPGPTGPQGAQGPAGLNGLQGAEGGSTFFTTGGVLLAGSSPTKAAFAAAQFKGVTTANSDFGRYGVTFVHADSGDYVLRIYNPGAGTPYYEYNLTATPYYPCLVKLEEPTTISDNGGIPGLWGTLTIPEYIAPIDTYFCLQRSSPLVLDRTGWNSDAVYSIGDVVTQGAKAWRCLSPNKGVTPTTGSYWSLFAGFDVTTEFVVTRQTCDYAGGAYAQTINDGTDFYEVAVDLTDGDLHLVLPTYVGRTHELLIKWSGLGGHALTVTPHDPYTLFDNHVNLLTFGDAYGWVRLLPFDVYGSWSGWAVVGKSGGTDSVYRALHNEFTLDAAYDKVEIPFNSTEDFNITLPQVWEKIASSSNEVLIRWRELGGANLNIYPQLYPYSDYLDDGEFLRFTTDYGWVRLLAYADSDDQKRWAVIGQSEGVFRSLSWSSEDYSEIVPIADHTGRLLQGPRLKDVQSTLQETVSPGNATVYVDDSADIFNVAHQITAGNLIVTLPRRAGRNKEITVKWGRLNGHLLKVAPNDDGLIDNQYESLEFSEDYGWAKFTPAGNITGSTWHGWGLAGRSNSGEIRRKWTFAHADATYVDHYAVTDVNTGSDLLALPGLSSKGSLRLPANWLDLGAVLEFEAVARIQSDSARRFMLTPALYSGIDHDSGYYGSDYLGYSGIQVLRSVTSDSDSDGWLRLRVKLQVNARDNYGMCEVAVITETAGSAGSPTINWDGFTVDGSSELYFGVFTDLLDDADDSTHVYLNGIGTLDICKQSS